MFEKIVYACVCARVLACGLCVCVSVCLKPDADVLSHFLRK